MQHAVEEEFLGGSVLGESEKVLRQHQMAAAGDRQEFRHALQRSQENRGRQRHEFPSKKKLLANAARSCRRRQILVAPDQFGRRRTPQFYLETPLRESGFGIEQGRFSLRLLARLIAAFLAFVGLTDDDPAVYFIVAFIRDDNPAEIVLVAEIVEDL